MRTPQIAIDDDFRIDGERVGGLYSWPGYVVRLSDRDVLPKYGLVVLSAVDALTHEVRHHMQFMALGGVWRPAGWRSSGDYRTDIVRYYTADAREMDALVYENRYAQDEHNQECLEWVRENAAGGVNHETD